MDQNLDNVYPAGRVKHVAKDGTVTPINTISTAENITYYNNNVTPVDNGVIPAGTQFINTPISDILDKLLYTYAEPKIASLNSMDNSDITGAIKDDVVYYKELGKIVDGFTLNVNFKAGSESVLTCTLVITKTTDGTTIEKSLTLQVLPNQTYTAQFDISKFITDCSFKVNIIDSKNTISSPIIEYRFVDVSYVGYVEDDIFDNGKINTSIISAYFSNIINNNYRYIKKVVGNKQTIQNITFDSRDTLSVHPVLLIPSKWELPDIICDGNGNIINSLYVSEPFNYTTLDGKVYEYTAVICKELYDTDFELLQYIEYRYEFDKDGCDCYCHTGIFKGTPLLTGYEMLANAPLDTRSAVETASELNTMKYKYEGLVTYCKELKQLMVYKANRWEPVSNQIYFTDKKPNSTDGNINDTAFNLENGDIYQKTENGWEFKGSLNIGTTGNCIKSLKIGKITTGDTFNVTNAGTETDVILDFEFPATNGDGKLLMGSSVEDAEYEKVFLRTIAQL